MKVKELKEKLTEALERLENYNENDKVDVVFNTYHLRSKQCFIGLGYDGFVDLLHPVESEVKNETTNN